VCQTLQQMRLWVETVDTHEKRRISHQHRPSWPVTAAEGPITLLLPVLLLRQRPLPLRPPRHLLLQLPPKPPARLPALRPPPLPLPPLLPSLLLHRS
jgi:hypothetical protein